MKSPFNASAPTGRGGALSFPWIFLLAALAFSFQAKAWEQRDLLQKEADLAQVKAALVHRQAWVPYPKYADRSSWDALTRGVKEGIIKKGEDALTYEWRVVKASDYLEFNRSGSRRIMEDPFGANTTALSNLVQAELAEGKGRFMDQIANGVWYFCEMTSWVLSAHVEREQSERTSLPNYQHQTIDLTSGDMASFFAWTYYFLKEELDKVNPMIARRLRENLQDRILDPYMNRSNFWWQAFNATPETMVNNWNPWCNSNVLTCFMLLENDPDKLATAVHRTMVSVDKFINYYHSDGACDEGPSYWGHAAGKMFDYLDLLGKATGGKVSIFDAPLIKHMGEYIAYSYVGDGWVVNFADASAKGGGEPGLIYRYGKAVGSPVMMQFAGFLFQRDKRRDLSAGRDLYRTLENLMTVEVLAQVNPSAPNMPYRWYPETEFCYMRNPQGFFFAGKGGYNAESHNHNDMGSFILYLDNMPMVIDAGVGTYTRQTFSSERYSIWTMQSNYHNLPMINGLPQPPGAAYRSQKVSFNPSKWTFSLDLSGAYPEEAAVAQWQRTYQLGATGLTITEEFGLKETKSPNQIHFLLWAKPNISEPGLAVIEKEGKKLKLSYDPRQFDPAVEVIPLDDNRLSSVWGAQIYRLSLNAREQKKAGKYQYTFEKL